MMRKNCSISAGSRAAAAPSTVAAEPLMAVTGTRSSCPTAPSSSARSRSSLSRSASVRGDATPERFVLPPQIVGTLQGSTSSPRRGSILPGLPRRGGDGTSSQVGASMIGPFEAVSFGLADLWP